MKRWFPAVLLVVLFVAFRLIGAAYSTSFPNFQPLPALILCSVIFLTGSSRWLVPAVWLATDPFVSLLQGRPLIGWHHLAIFIGIFTTIGIALFVRKRPTAFLALGGSALAAVAFYFLTNTVSFVADPMVDSLYPRSFVGFLQAQWTGPVGYGPTWIFLRNLLAANVLFTGLFLLARLPFSPALSSSPVLAKPR